MLFSESDRQIYVCPITSRRYDPLAVKRRMTIAAAGQFNALCHQFSTGSPVDQATAHGELTRIARAALELPSIDATTGTGVLDVQAYEALVAFTKWLTKKDKRGQSMPNSAPCTGCP